MNEEPPEEWWEVFRGAQALRERLRDAQRMTPAKKREELAAIKRETLELLIHLRAPHPLWALIAELWGSFDIDSETGKPRASDWSSFAARPPGQLSYQCDGLVVTDDAFLRVAKMEARSDASIPLRELSRRLNHELSERYGELHTETDYTKQIRAWRKRPDYRALVQSLTRHPLDD
jgi:hypothetical protein